ncbi:MAG: transposase [Planctomycetota bacterium]
MQVRFDRKTYRKRVQVETVVSMIKRRLGNHVRARTRWGQVRELAFVVLTHNLMILWCFILFYRAGLTPLISRSYCGRGPGLKRRGLRSASRCR